jgi:hypothetical protein
VPPNVNDGRADQLDAMTIEHALIGEAHRGVERGLPAHRRQQRVGPLLGDDLGDDLRGDGLDIGGVSEARIGHDRRRVRVDQDDPVPLGAQRFARLRARIVEIAGLTDDDRTSADDQNRFNIGALRHRRFACTKRLARNA